MLRSRVFLGGQAVSLLGDGLAALAVPLLVLQVTGSPVAAVLASVPRGIGYLAAGVPAGLVADRLDPRRVLVGADIVRASVFLALFALTGGHALRAWVILALAFTAGGATVFFDTALTITVRDVFTGRRLVRANSWLESANQGGQVIGPGAAGLLAAAGLLRLALLFDALTFLASLASLAALRTDPARLATPGARGRALPGPARSRAGLRAAGRELRESLRYLGATRLLLTLVLMVMTLNLCLGADKLIIFFAKATLHLQAAQVGLVLAAGGAGGVLAAAGTGPLMRRLGPIPAIGGCCAASGAALGLIAAATSMPLLLAGNLLYTWAIVAASVTSRTIRQVIVPRHLLGRVTAVIRLAGQVVTPVGAVLAGLATGLAGGTPRPVFAAASALSLLTVATAWGAGLRHEDGASLRQSVCASERRAAAEAGGQRQTAAEAGR